MPKANSAAVTRSTALILLLAFTLAGCGRPTGDLGRARASVWHDEVLPEAGRLVSAYGREELTSDFNLTNDEQELRDLSWSIIRPPHAADWISASVVEAQRTRITPELDHKLDPRSYYHFLRSEKFRSSDARYDRLIEDVTADQHSVVAFFPKANTVYNADQERLRATLKTHDITMDELKSSYGRIDENAKLVEWVRRALDYRLRAYNHAIRRLKIETPSENRTIRAEQALRYLAWQINKSDGPAYAELKRQHDLYKKPIPSRYTRQKDDSNLVK
ncbi:hypothetical protein [Coralliovum pocilloporae]|uniref:hypothetical protein n=1 Tax=Coralliovum pocilloporae TaxID=3066369 RepID=UPI0033072738